MDLLHGRLRAEDVSGPARGEAQAIRQCLKEAMNCLSSHFRWPASDLDVARHLQKKLSLNSQTGRAAFNLPAVDLAKHIAELMRRLPQRENPFLDTRALIASTSWM